MATRIEQLQESAGYWAEKVLEGTQSGLAVVGPGGLGKTFTIESLLARKKVDVDEESLNSHVTPLALFQTLYAFRDSPLLLLDDIEHIYKNDASVSILRAALWGKKRANKPMRRVVTYSTSREIGVPKRFEYNGGIILIGNKIPREGDPIVEALLTRIPCVEFSVSPQDIYEFMRKVMVGRSGYAIFDGKKGKDVKIPRDQCDQVIAELEKRGVTDLRILERFLIAWKDFRRDPERMALEFDHIARRGAVKPEVVPPKTRAQEIFLELVVSTGLPENEKAAAFSERTVGLRPGRETGYDRATYFRWKKKWASGELR